MEIYVPRAELVDGELQYRAIHRYKDVWLHIVYAPQSSTMRLMAEPIVRRSGVPEYTAEPIAEYRNREEGVSWWRFRVDGQVLQVSVLQDEPLGDGIHAQGVALAVSLHDSVSEEVA